MTLDTWNIPNRLILSREEVELEYPDIKDLVFPSVFSQFPVLCGDFYWLFLMKATTKNKKSAIILNRGGKYFFLSAIVPESLITTSICLRSQLGWEFNPKTHMYNHILYVHCQTKNLEEWFFSVRPQTKNVQIWKRKAFNLSKKHNKIVPLLTPYFLRFFPVSPLDLKPQAFLEQQVVNLDSIFHPQFVVASMCTQISSLYKDAKLREIRLTIQMSAVSNSVYKNIFLKCETEKGNISWSLFGFPFCLCPNFVLNGIVSQFNKSDLKKKAVCLVALVFFSKEHNCIIGLPCWWNTLPSQIINASLCPEPKLGNQAWSQADFNIV